jgi:hypothetical protein
MKLRKQDIAVFIENHEKLEEAMFLLDAKGEETDDDKFRLLEKTPEYNFISKWKMDGKWRIGNSDKIQVSIEELEEILNNDKL